MTKAPSVTERRHMPPEITVDGETYYRTGFTGTTLDACPFGAGHTSYEYWIDPDDDSRRLQAISPTQYWLD